MERTHEGDVGIYAGGVSVTLRPSLGHIARLGDGEEIIRTYVRVHSVPRNRIEMRRIFFDSLHILHTLTDCPETAQTLFGYHTERMTYRPGLIPMEDIVTLARHLIHHGVAGAPEPSEELLIKGEPMQSFSAQSFVAVAVAHLGMSHEDAWRMTMTGLIAALRAKYPPDKKDPRSTTVKENDEFLDWLDRVNAKRDAKAKRKKK